MGIGPHAIKLTRIIYDSGVLPKSFSVIELGSQDLAPTMEGALGAIAHEFHFNDCSHISTSEQFYKAIGAEKFACIDLDGKHNCHLFDLNKNLLETYHFAEQFDLVTNHGTTEHLFNQQIAFENMHRLTKKGGVMLHGLPFQGYQNHGMFNYNPSLFLDLAHANNYEVLGLFLSIDDKLYRYDEDFLNRYAVSAAEDCLLMAVLIKRSDAPFEVPYDGRYFSVNGRDSIRARETHIGTTSRSTGFNRYEFEGLDDIEASKIASTYANRTYRFIVPIWGEAYVRDFLDISLPSQLCDGNLFAFSAEEAVYTIVTTARDEKLIRQSPQFEALSKRMPVEFILHSQMGREHPYVRMTRAYNLVLKQVTSDQVCFFLTSDDFYSNGLFKKTREIIAAGKRVVMVPTLRVISSTFSAEIKISKRHERSAAEMIGLFLHHEHPMISACVINNGDNVMHALPGAALYRLDDGYVGRWNVMHPLAVSLCANPPLAPSDKTIDWNYPALNITHADDIYIIRDSDDGVIASPAPMDYSQDRGFMGSATPAKRIENLKAWIDMGWAINFHVLLFSQPVFFHSRAMGPEYKDALKSLDEICGPYMDYVKKRAVYISPASKGMAMALLTRAIVPPPLRYFKNRACEVSKRLIYKAWRKIRKRISNIING